MKKEFDIPREILSQFQSYRKGYYSGYWEITSTRTNQCDQEESVKHWNNNQMVITLHSNYWNDNTYHYFFKLEDNKIKINILATRYNGLDYWYDENNIPKGKRIINKVKKYLEEKLLKKGKN